MIFAPAGEASGLAVEWTPDTDHKRKARVSVALVDFDANVDFLPTLAAAANGVQDYYDFVVLYLPLPSGVIRYESYELAAEEVPHLYMAELEGYLDRAPESLNVEAVCCLTAGLISVKSRPDELASSPVPDAEEKFDDLFSASLATNAKVFAVSTYGLRHYAYQAGTSFAKATLLLALGELLMLDERWSLKCHPETVGCPLDLCSKRDEVVVSLKKMEFSHDLCRPKVKDVDMLRAIDALLALKVDPAD